MKSMREPLLFYFFCNFCAITGPRVWSLTPHPYSCSFHGAGRPRKISSCSIRALWDENWASCAIFSASSSTKIAVGASSVPLASFRSNSFLIRSSSQVLGSPVKKAPTFKRDVISSEIGLSILNRVIAKCVRVWVRTGSSSVTLIWDLSILRILVRVTLLRSESVSGLYMSRDWILRQSTPGPSSII